MSHKLKLENALIFTEKKKVQKYEYNTTIIEYL